MLLSMRFFPMIKLRSYYLLLLAAFAWSDSKDFSGEVLHYSAGFRILPAGNATLSFTTDSLMGETVYKLTTSVKTNTFLDAFYEVRDEIQSWISPKNYSLQRTIQTIREGAYHRDHTAHIQGDSILVWNDKILKLSAPVYDPIAFIYYLRSQDLSIGESFHFLSAGEKKIKEVMVHITGKERLKVTAGTFNCLIIEPVSPDGRSLLKNNGEMRVWLSNDNEKLPVKIELRTNIGIMVMKLKERDYSSH